jgi:hypothetical protein
MSSGKPINTPSWRSGRAAPPPPTPRPAWRTGAAPTDAPTRSRWAARVVAVLILFLIGCAALIWISFWLAPSRPARLLLVGAGYEENLAIPHNVPGRRGLEQLARLAQGSSPWSILFPGAGQLRLPQGPIELRKGTDWARGLEQLDESTAIVFFALHGGADEKGAYLIPQDAGPGEADRLRLETVLDALAQLPAEKNKLLVLDTTGLDAWWQLGMLQNDFARALRGMEERIRQVPNLVVLCASDAGQRSWTDPGRGTTVFAHYFLRGLGGEGDGNGDARLDALELHTYVRDNVRRWARSHRDADQIPLLLPEEGGEERARNISLTFRIDPNAIPDEGPEPVEPARVREAWQAYQKLRDEVPAPHVHSPGLLREYEATLLRMEELLRAGDADSADHLQMRLGKLAVSIRENRWLSLMRSLTDTLTMPAAAGYVGFEPDPLSLLLTDLWEAAPEQRQAVYNRLEAKHASKEPEGLRLFRLQMIDLTVRRALANPARDLERAAELIRFLDGTRQYPRPAEAHYVVMLQRDLPPVPVTDDRVALLRRALRLRLRAEEAALSARPGVPASSEWLYPWVRPEVERGDDARQRGQDLLFATETGAMKDAMAAFDAAEKAYREAGTRAETLRRAHTEHTRALAVLPYYSHWLAGSDLDNEEELLGDVEGLWKKVHQLSTALDPSAAPSATGTDLGALADGVHEGLAKLQRGFAEHVRRLGDSAGSSWDNVEAALATPLLAPEERGGLLRAQRLRDAQVRPTEEGGEDPAHQEYITKQLQRRARRQGRMALAVLGEGWFDEISGGEREPWSKVVGRLELFDAAEKWWIPLDRAGEEIGWRWREMPVVADRRARQAKDSATVEGSWKDLHAADLLTRRMDAAAFHTLSASPALAYRRSLAQGLLLWQAERTLHGHWASEGPRPYYREAGLTFTRDASDLDPWGRDKFAPVTSLQARLNRPGGLRLTASPEQHLTAGERIQVRCTLEAAAGLEVPGLPVVWADPSGEELRLDETRAGQRLALTVPAGRASEPYTVRVMSPALALAEADPPAVPQAQAAGVRWHGLYRGQHLDVQTPVRLHPVAEVTRVDQPPPADAALALRATRSAVGQHGKARGAIAIVLDCSGSMGPPPGQPMTDATRFRRVTGVLEKVLEEIPQGTVVSLWTFGQAEGALRSVRDAERTVKRLQDPVTLTGEEGQIAGITAKVAELVPWNESPILRTILRAREDVADAEGTKTILVLTDGNDNRFASDREINPRGEGLSEVLQREFKGSGISVNVVGFEIESKEEEKTREQFGVVRDMDPPGLYVNVKDLASLGPRLLDALRPKLRYRIVRADTVPVDGLQGVAQDAGVEGGTDAWLRFPPSAVPGTYQVELSSGAVGTQRVALSGGDRLLLNLFSAGRELALERSLFSEEPGLSLRPSRLRRGWRAAVLQNQRVASGLQMLATLEKKPDRRESVLKVQRPLYAWAELKLPDGVTGAFAVRWGRQEGYPAEAWGFDVPAWPKDPATGAPARPVLDLWWTPDRPPEPAAVLRRDIDLRTLGDLDKEVRADGSSVRLLSVAVEQHWVQTSPETVQGKPAGLQQRWCLAVRVSHHEGWPVWVEPEGLTDLAGQEHRFYARAGKYVGLFWFGEAVTEEQVREHVETTLAGLKFFTVGQFRREAEARGFRAEFADLGLPAPNQDRPQPPLGRGQ